MCPGNAKSLFQGPLAGPGVILVIPGPDSKQSVAWQGGRLLRHRSSASSESTPTSRKLIPIAPALNTRIFAFTMSLRVTELNISVGRYAGYAGWRHKYKHGDQPGHFAEPLFM